MCQRRAQTLCAVDYIWFCPVVRAISRRHVLPRSTVLSGLLFAWDANHPSITRHFRRKNMLAEELAHHMFACMDNKWIPRELTMLCRRIIKHTHDGGLTIKYMRMLVRVCVCMCVGRVICGIWLWSLLWRSRGLFTLLARIIRAPLGIYSRVLRNDYRSAIWRCTHTHIHALRAWCDDVRTHARSHQRIYQTYICLTSGVLYRLFRIKTCVECIGGDIFSIYFEITLIFDLVDIYSFNGLIRGRRSNYACCLAVSDLRCEIIPICIPWHNFVPHVNRHVRYRARAPRMHGVCV